MISRKEQPHSVTFSCEKFSVVIIETYGGVWTVLGPKVEDWIYAREALILANLLTEAHAECVMRSPKGSV